MSLFDSTLAGVCSLVTDGTHDTPKSVVDGFPLVKAKEIAGGIINFDQCEKISETDHKKVVSRSKPEFGDTIFAHIGASLGEAAFVNSIREFSIKNVALFKPNPNIVDPRYLYYYVTSHHFQERIKAMRTGSAQPFLGLSQLRGFSVRLHKNLSVQRRIASILSAYDDLIENNTRRISILEEMARRIYEEWFVHFRFPGHEQVKMVESELGLIPKGWEFKLKDCLASSLGGDWGSDSPTEKENNSVNVIRGTDFEDCQQGIQSRCPLRYISSNSFEKRGLRAGDIIVENSINSKSRTSGKPLLVTTGLLKNLGNSAIAASFCKVFRLKHSEYAPMLYLKMRRQFEQGEMAFFQNIATNGIANFQAGRYIDSETFLIPQGYIGSRLLDMLTTLVTTAAIYADKNLNLRATRDLLLPKLISGELDVSSLPEPEEVITA